MSRRLLKQILKWLSDRDNILESVDSYTFQNFENIQVVNLQENPCGYFPDVCDGTYTLNKIARTCMCSMNTCKEHKNCKTCDLEPPETCLECNLGYYQFGLTDNCYRKCESDYNDWTVTCEENINDVHCKFETTLGVCFYFSEDFDLTAKNHVYFPSRQISKLHEHSFDGVDKNILEGINLSYNEISVIPVGIFDEMYNLKELFLSENYLHIFTRSALSDLVNLENLWLDGNLLTTLDPEMIAKNEKLRIFKLDSNKITEIPENITKFNENLEWIDYSRNNLKILPDNSFSNNQKVTDLILERNQLISIKKSQFEGLTNLENLYLENNNISSIERDSFSNSKTCIPSH